MQNITSTSFIPRTTDTQWRHKSKISKNLGRCGRQNMLPPYLNIWDWDWIFGRAVKAISSLGVRSQWVMTIIWINAIKMCTLRFGKKSKIIYLFFRFHISFSSWNVEKRRENFVGLKFISFILSRMKVYLNLFEQKLCKHVTQIAN